MNKTDFPGIQQAADEASIRSQQTYIKIVRANLISGVIGALIAIYNFEQVEPKVIVYFISLMLLVLSLCLTIAVKYCRLEDLWYQGRALAESIKTLTWRYVTCSENFETALPQINVQTNFNDSISSLSRLFPDLNTYMKTELLNRDVISSQMNSMRLTPWQTKLNNYLTYRIQDQIDWYTSKATFNSKKRQCWLLIIISSQAISVLSCAWLVFFPTTAWNLVGFFTTLSASAIGWLQLKQYQSLVQAYTTASMELNQIKSLSNTISDEHKFAAFILDSENAISREHTTWLAQRRK